MQSTTHTDALTLDLGSPRIALRLAVSTHLPVREIRWLLRLVEAITAATNLDRHAALLEVAEAYGRAAEAGQYSDLIRESMLAAEQRARRLAAHLS